MNTGKDIVTDNLILKPSRNDRDNISFLRMLKEDGDFRRFCGVDYSDEHLKGFENYEENSCFFSMFRKDNVDEFIGYVGLAWQQGRYEYEFYIAKKYRGNGYCLEALETITTIVFDAGLQMDGTAFTLEKVYATTTRDNHTTIRVLEQMGFERNAEGPIGVAVVFFDEKNDTMYDNIINEYVLRKENRA